jgi:hypothetical protein
MKSIMLGCGKGSKKLTIDEINGTVKAAGMKEPIPVGQWFYQLGRTLARQMRKMLHAKGFRALSATPRTAV